MLRLSQPILTHTLSPFEPSPLATPHHHTRNARTTRRAGVCANKTKTNNTANTISMLGTTARSFSDILTTHPVRCVLAITGVQSPGHNSPVVDNTTFLGSVKQAEKDPPAPHHHTPTHPTPSRPTVSPHRLVSTVSVTPVLQYCDCFSTTTKHQNLRPACQAPSRRFCSSLGPPLLPSKTKRLLRQIFLCFFLLETIAAGGYL